VPRIPSPVTQILESIVFIDHLHFKDTEESYIEEGLSMLDQAQDSPPLDKG